MTKALELREIDRDLYEHSSENLWVPPAGRGVFGGQIIAGAMMSAQRTLKPASAHVGSSVDATGMEAHSVHAYFMLPGDSSRSIIYKVNRLRDGRSFATRSVTAVQGGEAIFGCEVSFHRPEASPLSHSLDMPSAPAPESLRSMQQMLQDVLADPRLKPHHASLVQKSVNAPFPIDVRAVEPQDVFAPRRVQPARQLVWIRCTEALGEDPYLHRAALAYASDWSISTTMLLPHGLTYSSPRVRMVASLDHIMHFTAGVQPRADEWMLYDMDSPVMRGGRGLNYGRIWTRDGALAVCCAQEAILRIADKPASAAAGAAPVKPAAAAHVLPDAGMKPRG